MAQYEIMLEQKFAGQQIVNRWNYISGEIPAGQLGALLALVGMGFTPFTDVTPFDPDTVAGKLKALQAVAVNWVQAVAKNIFDPTDYYAYPFPAGTTSDNGGSEAESPVIAAGFATNRTRADVRRGQKRFAGLVEGQVGDVGVLTAGAVTAWQELGDTMADINLVPVDGSTVSFTPYVFGRKRTVDVDGKVSYPYWPTAAEQLAHSMLITQWTLKSQIRTQGTRQYGRGA